MEQQPPQGQKRRKEPDEKMSVGQQQRVSNLGFASSSPSSSVRGIGEKETQNAKRKNEKKATTTGGVGGGARGRGGVGGGASAAHGMSASSSAPSSTWVDEQKSLSEMKQRLQRELLDAGKQDVALLLHSRLKRRRRPAVSSSTATTATTATSTTSTTPPLASPVALPRPSPPPPPSSSSSTQLQHQDYHYAAQASAPRVSRDDDDEAEKREEREVAWRHQQRPGGGYSQPTRVRSYSRTYASGSSWCAHNNAPCCAQMSV
jgi:hypothetical protein